MEIIMSWFTENEVTFLNILSVCIFIENRKLSVGFDTEANYKNVTGVLLKDGKIQMEEYNKLNDEFLEHFETGMVNNYVSLLKTFKDNPNIITPGKWVPARKRDHLQNSCVPCRSKSEIMYPF